MAYANPDNFSLPIGTFDNPYDYGDGGGGTSFSFRTPAGVRGKVRDIIANVTETFTDNGTTAKIQIGESGNVNKFAELDFGTTSSGNDLVASQDQADTLNKEFIPADTTILVTLVGSTSSGTAAGKAFATVMFDFTG